MPAISLSTWVRQNRIERPRTPPDKGYILWSDNVLVLPSPGRLAAARCTLRSPSPSTPLRLGDASFLPRVMVELIRCLRAAKPRCSLGLLSPNEAKRVLQTPLMAKLLEDLGFIETVLDLFLNYAMVQELHPAPEKRVRIFLQVCGIVPGSENKPPETFLAMGSVNCAVRTLTKSQMIDCPVNRVPNTGIWDANPLKRRNRNRAEPERNLIVNPKGRVTCVVKFFRSISQTDSGLPRSPFHVVWPGIRGALRNKSLPSLLNIKNSCSKSDANETLLFVEQAVNSLLQLDVGCEFILSRLKSSTSTSNIATVETLLTMMPCRCKICEFIYGSVHLLRVYLRGDPSFYRGLISKYCPSDPNLANLWSIPKLSRPFVHAQLVKKFFFRTSKRGEVPESILPVLSEPRLLASRRSRDSLPPFRGGQLNVWPHHLYQLASAVVSRGIPATNFGTVSQQRMSDWIRRKAKTVAGSWILLWAEKETSAGLVLGDKPRIGSRYDVIKEVLTLDWRDGKEGDVWRVSFWLHLLLIQQIIGYGFLIPILRKEFVMSSVEGVSRFTTIAVKRVHWEIYAHHCRRAFRQRLLARRRIPNDATDNCLRKDIRGPGAGIGIVTLKNIRLQPKRKGCRIIIPQSKRFAILLGDLHRRKLELKELRDLVPKRNLRENAEVQFRDIWKTNMLRVVKNRELEFGKSGILHPLTGAGVSDYHQVGYRLGLWLKSIPQPREVLGRKTRTIHLVKADLTGCFDRLRHQEICDTLSNPELTTPLVGASKSPAWAFVPHRVSRFRGHMLDALIDDLTAIEIPVPVSSTDSVIDPLRMYSKGNSRLWAATSFVDRLASLTTRKSPFGLEKSGFYSILVSPRFEGSRAMLKTRNGWGPVGSMARLLSKSEGNGIQGQELDFVKQFKIETGSLQNLFIPNMKKKSSKIELKKCCECCPDRKSCQTNYVTSRNKEKESSCCRRELPERCWTLAEGVIQGASTSPVITDLYLGAFERHLDLGAVHGEFNPLYLRWVDDMLVLGPNLSVVQSFWKQVRNGVRGVPVGFDKCVISLDEKHEAKSMSWLDILVPAQVIWEPTARRWYLNIKHLPRLLAKKKPFAKYPQSLRRSEMKMRKYYRSNAARPKNSLKPARTTKRIDWMPGSIFVDGPCGKGPRLLDYLVRRAIGSFKMRSRMFLLLNEHVVDFPTAISNLRKLIIEVVSEFHDFLARQQKSPRVNSHPSPTHVRIHLISLLQGLARETSAKVSGIDITLQWHIVTAALKALLCSRMQFCFVSVCVEELNRALFILRSKRPVYKPRGVTWSSARRWESKLTHER